jgi:hypothetical protein
MPEQEIKQCPSVAQPRCIRRVGRRRVGLQDLPPDWADRLAPELEDSEARRIARATDKSSGILSRGSLVAVERSPREICTAETYALPPQIALFEANSSNISLA